MTSKLAVETPPPVLVNAYLTEIARAYGVAWINPDEVAPQQSDDADNTTVSLTKSRLDRLDRNSQEPIDEKESSAATPQTVGHSDKDSAEDSTSPQTSKAEPSSKKTSAATSPPPPPEDEFDLLAKRFAQLKKR